MNFGIYKQQMLLLLLHVLVVVSESLQQGVLWLIGAYLVMSVSMVVRGMGVIGLLVVIIYVGAKPL